VELELAADLAALDDVLDLSDVILVGHPPRPTEWTGLVTGAPAAGRMIGHALDGG
jgi:hypothetical protein